MSSSVRFSLRSLLALAAALAVLLLTPGCGSLDSDLPGVWEAESGPSRLVFEFATDGTCALSVKVGKETNTTRCEWERQERRIRITNPRGQIRWFSIIRCAGDELVLRLDSGRAGLCHFRRSG